MELKEAYYVFEHCVDETGESHCEGCKLNKPIEIPTNFPSEASTINTTICDMIFATEQLCEKKSNE